VSLTVHRFESNLSRYGMLVPASSAVAAQLLDFDGRQRGKEWQPARVRVGDDEPNAARELGDLSALGAIPVLSQRALMALPGMFVRYGELLLLELEPNGANALYAYNVTNVVDCLDRRNTQGLWLD
jgi:hypothetical protein